MTENLRELIEIVPLQHRCDSDGACQARATGATLDSVDLDIVEYRQDTHSFIPHIVS